MILIEKVVWVLRGGWRGLVLMLRYFEAALFEPCHELFSSGMVGNVNIAPDGAAIADIAVISMLFSGNFNA